MTYPHIWLAFVLTLMGLENWMKYLPCDSVKINSDRLTEYLAIMVGSFLIHGHVPQFMLMATLVPIIKDKLASISISKNYRSVCITSLVLKLVDWVTINLFGETLGFHNLQFGYQ